jgi:2-polyprenyl-3-methyl-5-hydroxy-6-metoxy-1,4-benzoquinol methylase
MENNNVLLRKDEFPERCFICGSSKRFLCEEGCTLREAKCSACGASKRNSDVAKIIVRTFTKGFDSLIEARPALEDLCIYEAQASGPIHECLSDLPNYISSEYLNDTANGALNKDCIRCEDLQKLSFDNNKFDLVITQDVFEHIPLPEKAFSEIWRILKPDGYHIFTIPYHEGRKTLKRVELNGDEKVYFLAPIYHIDPINKDGALVYNDFGEDLNGLLDSIGFDTDIIFCSKWYGINEIPYIEDNVSYIIYQESIKKSGILRYFKYNSVVFRSKKVEGKKQLLEWTGERYLPFVDTKISGSEIHYEHLHRYAFASQFVKDKYVLDLASGEGYGSHMMSQEAARVVGIDIDSNAIEHARAKYKKENLEFKQCSILEVPIVGRKIFDVVVCFEALEHIEDHDKLLDEVKRILKEDGLFIVSTPNKKVYSDVPNYHNPFHLRELYYEDFKNILHQYFSFSHIFGQRVFSGSSIWPLSSKSELYCKDFVINKENSTFSFGSELDKVPMYYISISSDADLNEIIDKNSYLTDTSNMLINQRDSQIATLFSHLQLSNARASSLADIIKDRDTQIFSLSSHLQERDAKLHERDAKLHERDAQIATLSNHLQQSKARVSALEYELDEMRRSIIWQVAMKFNNGIVERSLPYGSKRRKMYDQGLEICRAWLKGDK